MVDKYTNPFVTAFCGPLFMLLGTTAVINGDLLIIFLFFALNFAILGAYVTEFHIFPGLYLNELGHKTALSALFSMFLAFIGFLVSKIMTGGGDSADPGAFSASSFGFVWVCLSIPSYLLMLFLIPKLNKRDLETEEAIRREKRKNQKSGGPPIMNRDGF